MGGLMETCLKLYEAHAEKILPFVAESAGIICSFCMLYICCVVHFSNIV